MKSWILIAREEMVVLGQQIKTSTKLSENKLCDKPITNTSSKIQSITIIDNTNAVLCKQCRLCKHDVALSAYSSKDSPYCSDCEKALSELVTWWGETTWLRELAKNKEQIGKDFPESINL